MAGEGAETRINMSEYEEDSPSLTPGPSETSKGHSSASEPTTEPDNPLGRTQNQKSQQDMGIATLPYSPAKTYPEDLQISWSWAHFIVFVAYGFISLVLIQGVLATVYAPHRRMSTKQLEEYLISKPEFAIGSMLLWYAAIFFFLYVTLSVLRGHIFWRTLGWRKLIPMSAEMPKSPLAYLFAGAGLSFFVALATASMKSPEHTPIEELFKYRQTAIMFVAMAVLVAPLVEETLFRGYLYPMFARAFGIGPAILLTGLLFGLMHGAQLGWTWSLVAMLTTVGVVFTLVRARTGTVFASFLMHLGYNGLISAAALVSTHGFTKMPGKM
jgi:membrane protease YdiL (CAAX protease family)